MLCLNAQSKASGAPIPEALDSPDAEMAPVPVPIPLIVALGDRRVELYKDLRLASAKAKLLKTLRDVVLV